RAYFRFPTFSHYVDGLAAARPAVNVAALIGHTSLRNNHMDRLDRTATGYEIQSMRVELSAGLAAGALGLSSGLAYSSANAASTDEVVALASALIGANAVYAT